MSDKTKKQIKEDEFITNKVLAVFAVCLMGVLWIMLMGRLLDHGNTFSVGMMVQKISVIVGGIGIVWGLYMLQREQSGKRNAQRRIICGKYITIVCVIFTAVMTALGLYGVVILKPFYVILPVLAVYYLIFHSYTPEFFLISVDCGFAMAMIWLIQRAHQTESFRFVCYVAVAIVTILALFQIAMAAKIYRNKGVLNFGKREKHMRLSANAYKMLTITPIFMTVITALSIVLSLYTIILYGIIAAYLVITAVYYTVKMM